MSPRPPTAHLRRPEILAAAREVIRDRGVNATRIADVAGIYLGTTTQVIIELAPDVRVISLEQNTDRSRADDRWEIGQRVRLGWHPEHALVLR